MLHEFMLKNVKFSIVLHNLLQKLRQKTFAEIFFAFICKICCGYEENLYF